MTIKRPTSKQPLPKNAKQVFKGSMFDVYQWEQKMFDGSQETFEKIKRADTVNIIPITKDGQIILSKQKQPGTVPFFGSLGGAIEKDETPLEAGKRELLEEAGMVADTFILWDAVQFIEKIDWVIYTFLAKNCKKVQDQNLDSGEQIELVTITFEEYLKVIAEENYRDTEVALKLFRLQQNPKELAKTKKLFTQ